MPAAIPAIAAAAASAFLPATFTVLGFTLTAATGAAIIGGIASIATPSIANRRGISMRTVGDLEAMAAEEKVPAMSRPAIVCGPALEARVV